MIGPKAGTRRKKLVRFNEPPHNSRNYNIFCSWGPVGKILKYARKLTCVSHHNRPTNQRLNMGKRDSVQASRENH